MKFDFLNSSNGEQSSKRLFTFILVLLYSVYAMANLFYGKTMKDSLEDNLFYLILAFFAGITGEKAIDNLSNKNINKSTTETKIIETETKQQS